MSHLGCEVLTDRALVPVEQRVVLVRGATQVVPRETQARIHVWDLPAHCRSEDLRSKQVLCTGIEKNQHTSRVCDVMDLLPQSV